MFNTRAVLSSLILLFLAACGGLQGIGLDAQILNFTANPNTIKAGEGATLAWTIIGGAEDSTVTLNPGDVNLDATGNYQVTPEETTTYTLSVSSEGTTATKDVTVTVMPGDPNKYDLSFTTQKNTPIHFLVPEKRLGGDVTAETSDNGRANPICSSPGIGCIFEFNVTYEPAPDFLGEEIITVTTFNNSNAGDEAVSTWKIKVTVVEDFVGLNTIEVQNIEDGTAGSLRQALIDAEPGATITFSEALKGKRLDLRARLKIYKDVTITGNVEIDSGVDIGENAEVKLSGMRFSGQLGRGVRSSALINTGDLVLEDVQISNIISDICDKFVTNRYGSLESYGSTTLTGSTEITENSRGVTIFDGGSLTLEGNAQIYANTGLDACGTLQDGGGVYIAEGGELIGADYDGQNGDDNIFDNQPDNVFFVAGGPNKCATQIVEFKSERLEEAIREELELSDAPITCARMKTLTELNASGDSFSGVITNAVEDLTGIEYATNLTDLILIRHLVEDFSLLSELTQLEKLSFGFGPAPSINELSNLKNLRELSLSYSSVDSLAGIDALSALESLGLQATGITDLSPLVSLSELKSLDISFNASLNDISALLELPWQGNDDIVDLRSTSGIPQEQIDALRQKVETVLTD